MDQRRAELSAVVDELARSWWEHIPVEHVCSPGCTHGWGARDPLLDRVAELVPASMQLARSESAKRAPRGVIGSPAPWSAGPAELLDDVHRSSARMVGEARELLGLGPLMVGTVDEEGVPRQVPLPRCSVDVGGRAALRALPGVWSQLRARGLDGHPLVTRYDEERAWPGLIELRVRGWAAQARRMLGIDTPRPRLRQIANPRHPAEWVGVPGATPAEIGPSCETCAHPSCEQFRHDRSHRWVMARCPWCGYASLVQEDDGIVCARRSCLTSAGGRPHWSWAELDRLGLLITSTSAGVGQ